jgi:hypothetical protein
LTIGCHDFVTACFGAAAKAECAQSTQALIARVLGAFAGLGRGLFGVISAGDGISRGGEGVADSQRLINSGCERRGVVRLAAAIYQKPIVGC